MRQISADALDDIARGAAVLGTGGGGDPYIGKLMAQGTLRRCGDVNLLDPMELAADDLSGTIDRFITEPFASNAMTKVPTTIATFGDALYAVTAGFAPPAPDFVVRLEK